MPTKFLDALLSQGINKFTRPLVKQLSPEVLDMLRKVGVDKILPVFSVVFSTLVPPGKSVFSGRINDFITELSVELPRAMEEAATGTTTSQAEKGRDYGELEKLLLNARMVDKVIPLLQAYADLFAGKSDREIAAIKARLSQLKATDYYTLLSMEKAARDLYVKTVILSVLPPEKSEKPLDEVLKEFKASTSKTLKSLNSELVSPALKSFDQLFAPGSALDESGKKFSNWAKDFRDKAKSGS